MNTDDIKILLKLGERITFECKKADEQIPNLFGKPIPHLPIR